MHNEGSCHKQQIGWPNCIREKLKGSNIVKKYSMFFKALLGKLCVFEVLNLLCTF